MFEKHKQIKKRLTEITTPMLYLIIYLYDVLKDSYYIMSNVRDTTNFTTKCLQTDMASYMDITHQQLILNVNIELVIWCFNC